VNNRWKKLGIRKKILSNDGMDELGALLCGHAKNAYWFGSQLTIHQARALSPYVSATSLQVCISILVPG
jgi:homospermidine synthase